MNFFWQRNNTKSHFLIGLLSITLLFTQNLQFHVHSMDHNPVQDFGDESLTIDLEHDQTAIKHLSIDTSHADHHDRLIHEMDASPDALVKLLLTNAPTIYLIALLFTLFYLGILVLRIIRIRHIDDFVPRRRSYFIPPLRAPPL